MYEIFPRKIPASVGWVRPPALAIPKSTILTAPVRAKRNGDRDGPFRGPTRQRAEIRPVDVFHRNEVGALLLTEVEDLGDVRMVQARGQLRFGQKHPHEHRIAGEVGENPLEHERLLKSHRAGGLGQEHLGHPAYRELAHELVLSQLLQEEFLPFPRNAVAQSYPTA